MDKMKIWTGWIDYSATGEGRTIKGIIAQATDEEAFKQKIIENFGDYFAIDSKVGQGIVRNELTEFLWSKQTLDFVAANKEAGTVSITSSVHFNFA
jgi:hypothetical protein